MGGGESGVLGLVLVRRTETVELAFSLVPQGTSLVPVKAPVSMSPKRFLLLIVVVLQRCTTGSGSVSTSASHSGGLREVTP